MVNLKQFLARQLNDHCESPSGIVKKTFYEWGEKHISEAISLGLCYLYSLIPNDFSSVESLTLKKDSKIVNFKASCPRFIDILTLTMPNGDMADVSQKNTDIRDLSPLLMMQCFDEEDQVAAGYSFEIVENTKGIVLFNDFVPAGSVIEYLCAKPPTVAELSDDTMCQYHPLIAEYALFWLFRTDSESKSSLDRARIHFEALKDFVQTKLLLEFSLTEDDYNLGRRKVDDN